MVVVRLLAWVLLALGFMLLGADVVSTMEMGVPVVRTVAEIIDLVGPTLTPAESGPLASVSKVLLEAPMWMVLGIVGVVLTLIFRPVD